MNFALPVVSLRLPPATIFDPFGIMGNIPLGITMGIIPIGITMSNNPIEITMSNIPIEITMSIIPLGITESSRGSLPSSAPPDS